MTHDDVLHWFRVRLLALVDELGNVRAACRILMVHSSTCDRLAPAGAALGAGCLAAAAVSTAADTQPHPARP